ncbi:hypothetical protein DAPPUDRAFT_301714 [Daphnia pulex]|uniref:Uncharacterized protein n=1 Tax=Daphnia pulex TaxID=6669 RepID=E9HJQ8_DAPPU|nr:hypothetical protein DAPPUDRAFT_301714 [Daphnia pulex]|eukprot:EFX68027.1 hypothetical protein DAPPUDRAFT_301714 [Daphnia pulex]
MTTIRYSHPAVMVTAFVLLTFIVSKSYIFRGVTAEFYIGEYQTFADHSARNKVKETNPVFHPYDNNMNDDSSGGIDDDDDDESNELIGRSQSEKQSRRHHHHHHHQHRQSSVGRGLSTFNPLTPGGTIYLAFIFLIPLTVGKTGFGQGKSYSKTNGPLERLIHKVQQDQQSLYSEMGYVDGNLVLRRAWRDIRDSLAKKLLWLPWRRRLRDMSDIVASNRNNGTNPSNRKKRKKKYYYKSGK